MKWEIVIISIVVIAVVATNFILSTTTTTKTQIIPIESSELPNVPKNVSIIITNRQISTIHVPAVDSEGNGVTTVLKVEAIPGDGKILTNINNLLFWVDTQYSIRVAESVAQNITKKDLTKIDLIYTIETQAQVIEGPSAGAALTIATIAAIENKTINPNVMITGTINPDGSIGPVGGIVAKAKVAKDTNATLFLVPEGQGSQTNYKPIKKCEKMGPVTYCTVEYKQEKVDVMKESGIDVKEVATIEEALKYFLE